MEWLLDLASPWAYVIVFAFAFAEGGLLVGLFLPGEAPVLLGGVLAFQGRASLGVMMAVAVAAAMIGDSAGYWLGRRYGARIKGTRLGRKVGEERWAKAEARLRTRGGRAVFFGRFVSIFRTLVPPVAGASRMPYARFAAYNVPAGALYAAGMVLAGYVAGGSWDVVDGYLGRASLVVLALVGVGALFFLGARWTAGHYADIRARLDRFLERPGVKSLRERYDREISFARRRFKKSERFGLALTVGIGLVVATGFLFGALLEEIIEQDTGGFDRSMLHWLEDHREPLLTDVMKTVTFFGGALFSTVVLTLATGVAFGKTRALKIPAFLAFCLVGATGLSPLVKVLVDRPRPDFSQLVDVGHLAFPSGHATASAIVAASLAFVLTRRREWRSAVWIWSAAGMASFLIGFSRLYLGVHWPTDVLGGWLLGLMWVALGAVLTDAAWAGEAEPAGPRYPAADLRD
ncbi:MAG: bifunctional DedA family/phosphatase PAP2 family protein [Actinomycetota bacterium]